MRSKSPILQQKFVTFLKTLYEIDEQFKEAGVLKTFSYVIHRTCHFPILLYFR